METKRRTRSTSIKAYHEMVDLSERQAAVYEIIRRQPICNLEIAERLNLPINSITGRVRELVDKGVVELSHKDKCATGRTVCFWKATAGEELIQGALL